MSDRFFTHILVLRPGVFPRLDTALVVGEPNEAGFVKLYQPVPWTDGPVDIVPTELCFKFDAALAKEVNGLVSPAVDALEQATHIIIERAKLAFQPDKPEQTSSPTIMH